MLANFCSHWIYRWDRGLGAEVEKSVEALMLYLATLRAGYVFAS